MQILLCVGHGEVIMHKNKITQCDQMVISEFKLLLYGYKYCDYLNLETEEFLFVFKFTLAI